MKNQTVKINSAYRELAEDPVFKNLGLNADLIDKMTYLSKKELAKHSAIKGKQNFIKFA